MYTHELLAMGLYFFILILIGYFSLKRRQSAADFILGDRSLNYWLTALSAHASDMSSWLFLAYPASIFTHGMIGAWTAIGLISCMFLNWQLVAPKIRVATERFNSLTFSAFFESRLGDKSGMIHFFSALILVVFYTVYISAFLIGLGDLLSSLFPISYGLAIVLGIALVIPYVFAGGYTTLAWIDLFQGCFLLLVILFVPFYLLGGVGGIEGVKASLQLHNLSRSLIPDFSSSTLMAIVSMALGWGLGYFGQPHIVTKFMGIRKVSDMAKSKWIGMSWMVLSLGGATLVGLVAVPFFTAAPHNPETIFLQMVKTSFTPFFIGFVLCAVLGATINAMSSQVLVLSSSLAEDFYKRFLRPRATSKEILLVSRVGVLVSGAAAFAVAFYKLKSIYALVEFAWAGIGSSFGPLILLSLYSNRVNKYGAWAGILGGGLVVGVWGFVASSISPMLPAFFVSGVSILLVSRMTKHLE